MGRASNVGRVNTRPQVQFSIVDGEQYAALDKYVNGVNALIWSRVRGYMD